MLHKASVAGMTMDPESNNPIVFLKTDDNGEVIPIWIGLLEATSIASVLQNIHFDRPMTHDLFKNFLGRVHVDLLKIEICDIRDNTFFARLHFGARESVFEMDARPSDAIALALRLQVPIFIDDIVIEKSKSHGPVEGEAIDTSREGKKWAEYLENLSPDAFGKYKV
jgi:bifunctional DNase/RNase